MGDGGTRDAATGDMALTTNNIKAVSGSLKNRMIEFVDHLHEYFIDPVVIKNGCYVLPQTPGYSITMKSESLERYAYPDGDVWREI